MSTRTLTVNEREVTVDNRRGIIDPGKFEGEMPHAVRDYFEEDEHTGDQSAIGVYAWRSGHRYYQETDDGFVTEIDKARYDEIDSQYAACLNAEADL